MKDLFDAFVEWLERNAEDVDQSTTYARAFYTSILFFDLGMKKKKEREKEKEESTQKDDSSNEENKNNSKS